MINFRKKGVKMETKQEIKEKYDKSAGKIKESGKIMTLHNDVSPVMKYFRLRKVEAAIQLANFDKGAKILEVGSNMGQYTILFAKKGFSMVGIDISDKAVEVAKNNARMLGFNDIEYHPMDVEDLNLFKDETFDGAVSFSTLRYVPNLKKSLDEIFRVTKKNGTVVLDFPNKHCPWFRLLKNKFGVENHIYDHFYSEKELKGLFEETGFQNIETKKIMFTHYTFNSKFLGIYKTIDAIGEHTFFIKELAAIILCKGIKP